MIPKPTPVELAVAILEAAPLLRTKLSRALFCPPESCTMALAELIKFLTLASESTNCPVTPSARVDMAWHEFILFTRTYTSFCERNYGKMIHHEPSDDQPQNTRQYLETLRLYRQRYGEPPEEYWGGNKTDPVSEPTAHCGNCETDS